MAFDTAATYLPRPQRWTFVMAAIGTSTLVLLLLGSSLFPVAARQTPQVDRHHTVAPLDFATLFEVSDRVVFAQVQKAPEPLTASPVPNLKASEFRLVTLRVFHALKGEVGRPTLEVKQYVPMSPTISENEFVVWFLPRDSKAGLASPVGGDAGSFRVKSDDMFGHVLISDLGNQGLWDSRGTLWDLYDRGQVKERLQTFSHKVSEVLQTGDRKDSADGPIPFDLVKALALVSPKQTPSPAVRP